MMIAVWIDTQQRGHPPERYQYYKARPKRIHKGDDHGKFTHRSKNQKTTFVHWREIKTSRRFRRSFSRAHSKIKCAYTCLDKRKELIKENSSRFFELLVRVAVHCFLSQSIKIAAHPYPLPVCRRSQRWWAGLLAKQNLR